MPPWLNKCRECGAKIGRKARLYGTGLCAPCYRVLSKKEKAAIKKSRERPNRSPSGIATGRMVLDPFAGSGTTMRVAMEAGRSATGIELNHKYVDYAKKRVNWGSGLGIEYASD